ncbi:MAG: dTDP-4-amino-4,6-dideoxygalactose transaminase [Anaerolineae bacterium]|nr:dTDP-4-amino-4,6-dideoxygalactose transaminase [Anaerolineae bacterium]
MSKSIKIDFNKPVMTGNELDYIRKAFENSHISGDGFFSKATQKLLEEQLGVPKVLLTTSCTHALEMAALLLDIKPDDEVIVPSFTFVSTVNAFVLRGARPVFIDIRPDTLNLDEKLLPEKITPKSRAIVPVHYAGVGCQMDAIIAFAKKYDLAVVEDNAHGLFGKFQGQYLGTFGCMATQSFHETKNITCGEGGALLINNPQVIERAEIIREKGTNRSRFFRGMVDKYTWVDLGSSYLPSDILAAVLLAQLEARAEIQKNRKQVWEYYAQRLQSWASKNQVQLPFVPEDCEQTYHMFYMILPSLATRQALMEKLRENGIISVFHYLPLHLSEMGKKFGGQAGDCPVTETVSDRLLRLPLYNSLKPELQDLVIDTILQFSP